MAEATLLRTPLHGEHAALGAKLVPFAGYEMPVQYPTGITAEHHAVRRAAGLFDVSHMGEFTVRGDRALDFVQYVTTNDVSKVEVGQAQYGTLLNHDGKLLDDLIVYRYPDHWMLVVNGSNKDKDLRWIQQFTEKFGVDLVDRTDDIALLALQGPKAQEILARLTDADLDCHPLLPLRRGHGGRRRRHHQPHRLHRRGRLRAVRPRRGRGPSLAPAAGGGRRTTGCSPPAWAAATRCAWRWATRCTATTWTRTPRRWRPGSAGWSSWTRATSWAATRWPARRSRGSRASWSASASRSAASPATATR